MATLKQPLPKTLPLDELEGLLVDRLNTGRAALPLLPHVASEAIRLASDPKADVNHLAKLVEKDPPIAARMLSFANSAIYARGVKTTSARAAIVRLGLAGARDLLFQVVYANSTSGLRRYQDKVARSFTRALLAAIATRSLRQSLLIPCDFDYLCGLLHDIGEGRVYRILAELPEPEEGVDAAEALVEKYHERAGAQLAEAWKLPQDITETCEKHHPPRDTLTDAVRLVMAADNLVLGFEKRRNEPVNAEQSLFLASLQITEQAANGALALLKSMDVQEAS